jgi:crotonobetainyl-CoA:carnitine CoA-transferase CaiB-like acyl-CoA transferase
MSGPLAGVKVVEIGVWVAGPAAGGVFADWGADVVKIEPPVAIRRARSRACWAQTCPEPHLENDNRSKRSITLD